MLFSESDSDGQRRARSQPNLISVVHPGSAMISRFYRSLPAALRECWRYAALWPTGKSHRTDHELRTGCIRPGICSSNRKSICMQTSRAISEEHIAGGYKSKRACPSWTESRLLVPVGLDSQLDQSTICPCYAVHTQCFRAPLRQHVLRTSNCGRCIRRAPQGAEL